MAIRELVLYPDPLLKAQSAPVTEFNDELKNFLDDMQETMVHDSGIGLAAPQVGVSKQIAVVDLSATDIPLPELISNTTPRFPEGRLELINPTITQKSYSVKSEEGCLSIPGFRDTIQRSHDVVVSAQDRFGTKFEVKGSDLYAFVFQHEIDHLNGILFVDHLSRLKRALFLRWVEKQDWKK